MPTLPADRLRQFVTDVFCAADVPDDEADQVAESLVEADLCGHESHGVMRTRGYVRWIQKGALRPGAELEILKETPAALACDGGFGFGQVQARRLVDRSLAKARESGVASATARNCGHVGRLAEWTDRAARQGFLALMAANDNGILRLVAPPGGLEPMISTNPLSLAAPTGGEPLVFDMSTSVVAAGKVAVVRADGELCPEGWLQDAQGAPTRDPNIIKADPPGTILPLGGPMAHKGFGLGVMVDVLSAGLAGGFCPPPRPEARDANNVTLVLWDPDFFGGREHLQHQAGELADSIRNSKRRPGVERITLPGDRSRETRQQRLASGIPVREGTWQRLVEIAAELRVEVPAPVAD